MGDVQDEFITRSRRFDEEPTRENMMSLLDAYYDLLDKYEDEGTLRFTD